MGKKDPRIDAYIEKSADFAKPILIEIRKRMHAAVPDIEENIKWSMPHFQYQGKLFAHLAAFKAHAAFGFALIGAVVGEYAGADKGLGLLIANAQGTFDAAGIYAGMIIITVVALLAEYLLTLLENRLLRWRPPVQTSGDTYA